MMKKLRGRETSGWRSWETRLDTLIGGSMTSSGPHTYVNIYTRLSKELPHPRIRSSFFESNRHALVPHSFPLALTPESWILPMEASKWASEMRKNFLQEQLAIKSSWAPKAILDEHWCQLWHRKCVTHESFQTGGWDAQTISLEAIMCSEANCWWE